MDSSLAEASEDKLQGWVSGKKEAYPFTGTGRINHKERKEHKEG